MRSARPSPLPLLLDPPPPVRSRLGGGGGATSGVEHEAMRPVGANQVVAGPGAGAGTSVGSAGPPQEVASPSQPTFPLGALSRSRRGKLTGSHVIEYNQVT